MSVSTYEDSHHPFLFVLPLLSAAIRFSDHWAGLPGQLAHASKRSADDGQLAAVRALLRRVTHAAPTPRGVHKWTDAAATTDP